VPDLPKDLDLSLDSPFIPPWTRPCPKGGRFRSRAGNHDLKKLLMRFDLLLLLLRGTSAKGLIRSL
jgi:hypothetical protein